MVRYGTTRNSLLVVVVATASVSLSCGGGPQADSVAGVDAVSPAASEDGTSAVSASGKKAKIQICHKGKDKWVPPSAVAGHKRHGDTEGSCSSEPDVVTCPCFNRDDIEKAASQCSVDPITSCAGGVLTIACDPGGTVPAGSIYFSVEPGGGSCGVYPGQNSMSSDLSSAESLACEIALSESGFCS